MLVLLFNNLNKILWRHLCLMLLAHLKFAFSVANKLKDREVYSKEPSPAHREPGLQRLIFPQIHRSLIRNVFLRVTRLLHDLLV